MVKIFISYRRSDTPWITDRIRENLQKLAGRRQCQIFVDVHSLEAGQNFDDEIANQIASSDVLLVVIGKNWNPIDKSGTPRLFDEADYVRKEISLALEHGRRIIPILVDEASLPSPRELPPELSVFTKKQTIQLQRSNFESVIDGLAKQIFSEPDPVVGRPKKTNPAFKSRGVTKSLQPHLARLLTFTQLAFFASGITTLIATYFHYKDHWFRAPEESALYVLSLVLIGIGALIFTANLVSKIAKGTSTSTEVEVPKQP